MDKWRCTERGISKNNKQTVCATGRRHFGKATQNRDLKQRFELACQRQRDLSVDALTTVEPSAETRIARMA